MRKRLAPGMAVPDFRYDTIDKRAVDFRPNTNGQRGALFFLRYVGCPVCQLKLAQLTKDHDLFHGAGLRVFAVLQSNPSTVAEALSGRQLPFTIICDPDGEIFERFGVAPGNLLTYLAPSALRESRRASREGFRHGKREGNEMQLPAVFVTTEKGLIEYAYYGATIADVPSAKVILEAARAEASTSARR